MDARSECLSLSMAGCHLFEPSSAVPLFLSGMILSENRYPLFRDHALMVIFPRVQAAGHAEHNQRRVLLVFRRRIDLLLGQFQRNAVALAGDAAEMQRVPID